MQSFPENIQFKYPWRKYQQRVLNELTNHLQDQHLHIIAPPGSGKTILGLEVALRLNKPTLVLAPTIAIRNQWINRFCELFLNASQQPDWISSDIRKPGFLTVATYQGVHAACNMKNEQEVEIEENEEESSNFENESTKNPFLDEIVNGLKAQNIQTIIVDEAHHLKNEWWETLTKVKAKLNPIIVGLTATPPYDVSYNEWQRYIELTGPVDTEITVPELIIEGDLCPHQDYVHFSLPDKDENKHISQFRDNIQQLFEEIKQDEILSQAIEQHPIWINPLENLEWIYNNVNYYSACLIYQNAKQKTINPVHLDVIGDTQFKIPPLDYNWTEILLDFYLNIETKHFETFVEHKQHIANKLRRFGAMERKQIHFSHNKRLTGLLTTSISKLASINEIVSFEHKNLGNALRLVILTDYIRKEYLNNSPDNLPSLDKIGIIPIFENIRRNKSKLTKIGVLTGSVVIIPKSAITAFLNKSTASGIENVVYTPYVYDGDFILIQQNETIKNDLIHIITQIFQDGEIEVLIGTKSLLGEGWDAPAINALILASFVGSFVLSNQMRGRAIRTQQGNLNKTGNIWHLVTIDPSDPQGGEDLDTLKRRFKSFVGISFDVSGGIENGIKRLQITENTLSQQEIDSKNKTMFEFASNRAGLKIRWEKAIQTGFSLVEAIKIPFPEERNYKATKSMYYQKTIRSVITTLAIAITGYFESAFNIFQKMARSLDSPQDIYYILAAIFAGCVLFFGRRSIQALTLYIKYRDITKDIRGIGNVLLNSLIESGAIQTDPKTLSVTAIVDDTGAIYCHLEGGTTFEKSTFILAFKEILAPINNPRYVILRKSKFMIFVKQVDYHALPEILGKKKSHAEYFYAQWNKLVGSSDLIYTRSLEGRKLLLKSRLQSLAAQFIDTSEHVNKWK